MDLMHILLTIVAYSIVLAIAALASNRKHDTYL